MAFGGSPIPCDYRGQTWQVSTVNEHVASEDFRPTASHVLKPSRNFVEILKLSLWDTHESGFCLSRGTHVESGFCCFVGHTWSPDFVVLWVTRGVLILLFCGTHMESGFCCGWDTHGVRILSFCETHVGLDLLISRITSQSANDVAMFCTSSTFSSPSVRL